MSLEDTLSNMTLYDAKKYFRKAQNVVFNYTDMEGKVREATNNEPWGASSTLMEQIAQATYNMREREEVLGMIFRRFTEKAGSEWRQIYKALQLLEYLIKRGSERFIDDTRSSIRLIKLLESFHYIDSQGRDQGINVRNRAKAITELLQDDEMIRQERKKARETAKKYRGVAGGVASSSANPRAGFNSSTSHGISVSADFDSDEDEELNAPGRSYYDHNRSNTNNSTGNGFKDDVELAGPSSTQSATESNTNLFDINNDDEDEDEFDDFQSAVPVSQTQSSVTQQREQIGDLSDLISQPVIGQATPAYQQQEPVHTQMPDIVPAIAAQKKEDPFGSLFTSAKQVKESKPVISSSVSAPLAPSAPSASAITEEDDDDLFGELTSSTNPTTTGTSNSRTKANSSSNSNNEIDLLSF